MRERIGSILAGVAATLVVIGVTVLTGATDPLLNDRENDGE